MITGVSVPGLMQTCLPVVTLTGAQTQQDLLEAGVGSEPSSDRLQRWRVLQSSEWQFAELSCGAAVSSPGRGWGWRGRRRGSSRGGLSRLWEHRWS